MHNWEQQFKNKFICQEYKPFQSCQEMVNVGGVCKYLPKDDRVLNEALSFIRELLRNQRENLIKEVTSIIAFSFNRVYPACLTHGMVDKLRLDKQECLDLIHSLLNKQN